MPPKIGNVPRPIDVAPPRAQSAPPALDRERSIFERHSGKIIGTAATALGVLGGPLTVPAVGAGLLVGAGIDYVRGRRSAPGPGPVKRGREETASPARDAALKAFANVTNIKSLTGRIETLFKDHVSELSKDHDLLNKIQEMALATNPGKGKTTSTQALALFTQFRATHNIQQPQ
ncbi:MAG: hypothetical protein WCK42_08185 [Myxococcaceae bacterium]